MAETTDLMERVLVRLFEKMRAAADAEEPVIQALEKLSEKDRLTDIGAVQTAVRLRKAPPDEAA